MTPSLNLAWPVRGAAAIAAALLAGCATTERTVVEAPATPREFRAVWVATVANIDWPSKPGLPVAQQRAEMNAILDRMRALNLNAVILQVRPAAAAVYASTLEPWSEYLTGEQGRDPGYDPLAEWIEGAHRRGLELHAWFNPYRARHHEAKSPLAASHLAKTNPAVVKAYGKLLWMDPGEPLAAQRTLDVIRDVVRRYDIDGVHIDDYFYPYPIKAPGAPDDVKGFLDFPDEPAWEEYCKAGGKLNRADWRRHNVDQLVERIHRAVHETKPWVKFGISPFGLGRPALRPPGIEGFSQYDGIFADAELWLQRGWLDYFTPQLYWPIDQKPQAFPVLLDYWAQQNTAGRHLWPGLFTSAINDTPESWPAREITRQVEVTRAHHGATGHVHFSAVALMQDRKGVTTALQAEAYAQPTLVPATPWLDRQAPGAPTLRHDRKLARIIITPAPGEPAARYTVWKRHGAAWRLTIQPATDNMIVLTQDRALGAVDVVVVGAVDRVGNESTRTLLALKTTQLRKPRRGRGKP